MLFRSVEMFGIGHLVAQVGQKAAFDRIQVFDVFVYQFESPLQRTPADVYKRQAQRDTTRRGPNTRNPSKIKSGPFISGMLRQTMKIHIFTPISRELIPTKS